MGILNDTVLFLHCQFYDSYLNIYRPNQSREACKPCLARPPLHTRVLSWRFAVLRTLVSCVVVVQGPVLLAPVFPALPSSGDASWTVRVGSKHGKQRKLRGSSRVSLIREKKKKVSLFSSSHTMQGPLTPRNHRLAGSGAGIELQATPVSIHPMLKHRGLSYKVYFRCSSISMMAAWLPHR